MNLKKCSGKIYNSVNYDLKNICTISAFASKEFPDLEKKIAKRVVIEFLHHHSIKIYYVI